MRYTSNPMSHFFHLHFNAARYTIYETTLVHLCPTRLARPFTRATTTGTTGLARHFADGKVPDVGT